MSSLFVLNCILPAEYFIFEVCIDDVLQSSGNIISIFVLLLDSIHEFLLHENTSLLLWHITRTNIQEVDGCADIHAPGNTLFNVYAESQRLFSWHLAIRTRLRITTAVITTLGLNFDTVAFLLFENFGEHHIFLGLELVHKLVLAIGVGHAAVSITFRLFTSSHDLLRLPFLELFFGDLFGYLLFFTCEVFLLTWQLDFVVSYFIVLSFGWLVKFLVPHIWIAVSNYAIIILVVWELDIVVSYPFLAEFLVLLLDDLIRIGQEVRQVDLGEDVEAAIGNRVAD